MSRDIKLSGRRSGTSISERFLHMFGTQLGNPRGLLGRVIGRVIFAKGNASINTWIVQLLTIQPTDRILEVGCGPGLAIQGFAARATQGLVAGIDASPVMVQEARKRNAAAIEAGYVEIQQGNASMLPYTDASFDTVIAIHVIYFWSDPVATLQELCRVLRPGGLVAIGFRIKEHMPRSTQKAFAQSGATTYPVAEDVVALLAAAGFNRIRMEVQSTSGDSSGCCVLGQK
jgi:ubiquinone/menaquinone biosynthesis C-methylase UbiE